MSFPPLIPVVLKNIYNKNILKSWRFKNRNYNLIKYGGNPLNIIHVNLRIEDRQSIFKHIICNEICIKVLEIKKKRYLQKQELYKICFFKKNIPKSVIKIDIFKFLF